MKKIISLAILLGLILTLTLSSCDDGGCRNCNLDGTPFPTLEAEAWPSE